MVLYFIRHGIPDYQTDALLPEGWEQAKRVSRRMAADGLDAIYSSPMGRARETAAPTSELLGLPVTVLPWAAELGDESKTMLFSDRPHTLSTLPNSYLHAPKYRHLTPEGSLAIPGLAETEFPRRYREISEGLDALLRTEGYVRTKDGFYRPVAPTDRHVALFCHAGMMRVMLSHLYNVPYNTLASILTTHFTGVTVLIFSDEEGDAPTVPYLASYGDVGHLFDDGPLTHYFTGKTF